MELASPAFADQYIDFGAHPIRKPTDIHLSAAGTEVTDTRVRVTVSRVPACNVGLATDELDIARALAVAVAG
jgi:hypothetical protein